MGYRRYRSHAHVGWSFGKALWGLRICVKTLQVSDGSGLGLYASEDTKAHDYKDKLTGLEFELRFRVRVSGVKVSGLRARVMGLKF